jgi:hypothetical protein
VAQTIHYSQELTLDCSTFDLTSVIKYGLTYITLLTVHSKEHFYLFFTLLHNCFGSRSFGSKKNVLSKNKCTIQTCYCFFLILSFKFLIL